MTRNAHKYPPPDKPLDQRDAAARLDAIAEQASIAGIDLPAVEAGRELIGRCRDYLADSRRMVEDRGSAIKRIARALVSGDLDLDGAAKEAARIEAMQPGGVFATAVRQTENIAARRAFEQIAADLDGEAVLSEARATCAECVQEIKKLRRTLGDITDAEQASAAGTKQAAAWSKYRQELLPRFHAAHRLIGLLRDLHWVQPLRADQHARQFARYDLVEDVHREARKYGPSWRLILDERDDLGQPGGPFTESELDGFDREVEQQRREADAEADAIAANLRGTGLGSSGPALDKATAR